MKKPAKKPTYLPKNLTFLGRRWESRYQERLAEIAGIAQSTVSKLINGKQDTSYVNVMAWAEFFRVTADDLIGRDLEADGPSPARVQPEQIDEAIFRDAFQTVRMFLDIVQGAEHSDEAGAILAFYRARQAGDSPAEATGKVLAHLKVGVVTGGEDGKQNPVSARGRAPSARAAGKARTRTRVNPPANGVPESGE